MSKKNLDINGVTKYNILPTMYEETKSALDRSAIGWALDRLNAMASNLAFHKFTTQPEELFGVNQITRGHNPNEG